MKTYFIAKKPPSTEECLVLLRKIYLLLCVSRHEYPANLVHDVQEALEKLFERRAS